MLYFLVDLKVFYIYYITLKYVKYKYDNCILMQIYQLHVLL